jgi:hypothetical protein
LRSHNPWAENSNEEAPDPDEVDITEEHHIFWGTGPGGVQHTQRTVRTGTPRGTSFGEVRRDSPLRNPAGTPGPHPTGAGPSGGVPGGIQPFDIFRVIEGIIGAPAANRPSGSFDSQPNATDAGRSPSAADSGPFRSQPASPGPQNQGFGFQTIGGGPGQRWGGVTYTTQHGSRWNHDPSARLVPRDANNPQPRVEPVDNLQQYVMPISCYFLFVEFPFLSFAAESHGDKVAQTL